MQRTLPPQSPLLQSQLCEQIPLTNFVYQWDLSAGTLEEMSLMNAIAELVPEGVMDRDRTRIENILSFLSGLQANALATLLTFYPVSLDA